MACHVYIVFDLWLICEQPIGNIAERFHALCLKDSGVLYEDPYIQVIFWTICISSSGLDVHDITLLNWLVVCSSNFGGSCLINFKKLCESLSLFITYLWQIGIKAEWRAHHGRLVLFLGNKNTSPLDSVQALILPPSHLKMELSVVPETIPPRSQVSLWSPSLSVSLSLFKFSFFSTTGAMPTWSCQSSFKQRCSCSWFLLQVWCFHGIEKLLLSRYGFVFLGSRLIVVIIAFG